MNLAEYIIKIESFNANVNIPLLKEAYQFAVDAHTGQKRQSGEPYVEHSLNVSFILAELHLDSATLAAALMHDVVEDTNVTLKEIEERFGEEIATLVDGVTKLGALQFKSSEEQQVEYFRKMLLSMARDIRVILIKLADRLHNMRTLQYVGKEKQKRIAAETREVYAPLAHRFGIARLKTELEDLSMKFLFPEVYRDLVERLEMSREERERYVKQIIKPIKKALSKAGMKAEVNGRAKHLDSIYRKIKIRNVPFDKIADLMAIRIIVRTKAECYHAMGVVHELWQPVMGKFADFIATPKPNNYQSLHTVIIGPENRIVEIQIRTQEMHRIAENGIAAHWLYKEGRQQLDKSDRQMLWLRDVLDWQKEMINPAEFLEYLKIDLFADDIYVFTPNGEIKHLPAGATPLDFAFTVHTEVGFHCSGSKVNGRICPLGTRLNSGDEVEIMTSPQRNPTRDWLKLAKTSQARSRIRRWLRQAGFQQAVALGKEMFERKFRKLKEKFPTDDELLEVAQGMSFTTVENLYYSIGDGRISAENVIERFMPEKEAPDKESTADTALEKFRTERGIKIGGIDDTMFRYAKCCQPIPGEEIIGYVTRGRGVTIHRADCPNAAELLEQPERTIPVSWNVARQQTFVVRLLIQVESRKNILFDITESIADANTNVRGADIDLSGEVSKGVIIVEVKNLNQLEKVIKKIGRIKGVLSVRRANDSDMISTNDDSE
ncbi:MAG: bifunctional (p)ppGpp synthetase/guanosine-3',5'-bis(diphosphate) 3'-pyrophosphohydrolase [Candidatus Zixiibacteriota bacterium]